MENNTKDENIFSKKAKDYKLKYKRKLKRQVIIGNAVNWIVQYAIFSGCFFIIHKTYYIDSPELNLLQLLALFIGLKTISAEHKCNIHGKK